MADRFARFIASPPGRYLLAWEQVRFDAAVTDVFGYHALQCGLPALDSLRTNRIGSRMLACMSPVPPLRDGQSRLLVPSFEELPFASQSLDLVVLPHVLELSRDPYAVLNEVDRVLRPEGRVLIAGLNPVSLWGLRQSLSRGRGEAFVPGVESMIALPRLRDWLRLLSFELDRGRYGCYRPPFRGDRAMQRLGFLEPAGDRWWPICGAVYLVGAVKRVRAMRLVGALRKPARAGTVGATAAAGAPSVMPAAGPTRPADTCSSASRADR